MSFGHGKNTVLFLGAYDIGSFFNSADSSDKSAADDTTTFGNDAKTFIQGLAEGSVALSGLFDGDTGAINDILRAAIYSANDGILSVGQAGIARGSACALLAARSTTYDVNSPVGGVVSTKFDAVANGGTEYGQILAGRSAVSVTGNETSVDSGASSANGAVAHLHLTANAQTGASTIKVQHSANNSVFVDLLAFTVVALGTTATERVIVAPGTTVNRYLRASYTLAGAGSVTATVTLARR